MLKELYKTNLHAKENVLVSHIVKFISPITTYLLLKTKLRPNDITILMIFSGIIGAILFAIDNLLIKILGIIFIYLWFTFDLSDGEVARIKKQFSKFGKEIDYCAHIINHPLFNISFAINLVKMTGNSVYYLIFMILISCNLVYRFIINMNYLYALKTDSQNYLNKSNNFLDYHSLKSIIIQIINIFIHYPNFALIFPVIFLINSQIAIYYLFIVVIINCIYIPYLCFNFVNKIKAI